MRRLFALGMLLLALGTVFPAAAEEKVPEPVYQDESVTITLDHMTRTEDIIHAGFLVSCAEDSTCGIIPHYDGKLWAEDSDVDFIDAMKMIKQTGGGKLAYTCPAGQSVMCEFAWDLKEIYDYAPMGCLFPIALPELAGENVDFSWLGIFGPSAVEMEPENVIVSLDAELPEKVGFTFAVGTADMVVRQNEYYSGRAELSELEKEVKKIVHLEFRPE